MNHPHEKSLVATAGRKTLGWTRMEGAALPKENAAVLDCQNCGLTCTHITWIPEYEIEMCDTCRDEAMVALQKRSIEVACPARFELANSCTSLDEFRVALRAHIIACFICRQGGKAVPSDVPPLNQAPMGQVA